MPEPQEWPTAYARVQQFADRDIIVMLRQAYRDINKQLALLDDRPGIGAAVRREQLLAIQKNILRSQADIFRKTGDVIRARRAEAAARAIQLGDAIDVALLERAGATGLASALRTAVTRGLDETVKLAILRVEQSQFPLAERIYRTRVWMDGRIQNLINSAITRGLSAREFATEARDWFRPDTPGGARYASMRLARTEINNVFHAASVNHSADKPWVTGMKWHLSRSHPKPDECDKFAHGGPKGDGVYRVQDVPRKPHPQCFCYVTPVTLDEDEFLDRLVAGDFDNHLDARGVQPRMHPTLEKQAKQQIEAGKSDAAIATDLVRQFKGKVAGADHPTLMKELRALRGGTAPTPAKVPAAKVTPAKSAAPFKLPAIPKTAPVKAVPSPAKVTSVARPTINEHLDRITQGFAGKEREDALKALREQASFVPGSVRELHGVRKMSAGEARAFEDKHGVEALGGYAQREIVVHPSVVKPGYQRAFQKEQRSGWFSPCGHEHSGFENFIAHENGHHVDAMMQRLGLRETKSVWDTVGHELGVKPPSFYDTRSLNQWAARNQDLLKHKVSGYGATAGDEMLAEIWAEYTTNPNARPHIRRIGDAMRDLAERNAAR